MNDKNNENTAYGKRNLKHTHTDNFINIYDFQRITKRLFTSAFRRTMLTKEMYAFISALPALSK